MINQPPPYRANPSYRYPTLLVQQGSPFAIPPVRPAARGFAASGASARTATSACFAGLERGPYGTVLNTYDNRKIVQTSLLSAVRQADSGRLERMLNELGGTALCTYVLDCCLPSDFAPARPGDTLLHFLAGRHVSSAKAAQMTTMLLQHGATPSLFNNAGETAANRAVTHKQYMQLIALVASPRANLNLRTPTNTGSESRRWETLYNQIERLGDVRAMQILTTFADGRFDRNDSIDLPRAEELNQRDLLVPAPPEHQIGIAAATSPLELQFDREGLPTYAMALAQAKAAAKAKSAVFEPPPIYSEKPSTDDLRNALPQKAPRRLSVG
ncbi:MAG: hypothetical protein JWQ11_1755 [Rhizobacter sp.]|nr:hypothetical protein [Rhizobacter sp.]